jgi:ribonuclease HII
MREASKFSKQPYSSRSAFGKRGPAEFFGCYATSDESAIFESRFRLPSSALRVSEMPYCIGTDEAGYGPNLGPLVVTATLWRLPEGVNEDGLYDGLAEVITTAPTDEHDGRAWLADSKTVYSPAVGLKNLELGVLAALGACGLQPTGFRELFADVAHLADAEEWERPWHDDVRLSLPHVCCPDALQRTAGLLRAGLATRGVELVAVRSRCVFPAEFNAAVERMRNKATVLTAVTLGLVRELLERTDGEAVTVACDKHGGRNTYAAALQEHVVDGLVQTVCESRATSRYRFKRGDAPVEIGFHVGGESRLATALASMVSKYLREIAMLAWNSYWCRLIPDIRPTAGYPGDSTRYRRDIARTAREQKLQPRIWWRTR